MKGLPLALSSDIKRSGRETDHITPSSVYVKNEWNYSSTPSHVFMAFTRTTSLQRSDKEETAAYFRVPYRHFH
jgi:hypothetical protein